ncbi:methylthioribose-1-phosphate isomerase [Candidatus Methylomirabilis lanthanidiphila]|uniref:Methylthioribose-1-phosphate isomerase n=1 Tax=Candidatus Methylomirabilis lanthanidiphila TaxID=2211376 RepID=A0A564ZFU2_9BACT|nr:S-methyl-5-thioribose-1-phosphate isomerase [Candidatus Methylomirabilis lanthanidiphila]VUZ84221.1 methylthioribose-1-phosphate isomerase [Candidatus Methylomirabilis lanthanidiphila]
MFETIEWTSADTVRLLDQTRLPAEEVYVECRDVAAVAHAIRSMQIRGAPAIGVAGAMGLALAAQSIRTRSFEEFRAELSRHGEALRQTRPTAVNLAWGIDRMQRCVEQHKALPVAELVQSLIREAQRIREEDILDNQAIGAHGHRLIPDGAAVLTHCNAGALATAGYGTALGVIRAAHAAGTRLSVWAGETRPFLQGARLTAWELQQDGIPVTLITDNMAGHLMQRGEIDLVIVGADRIARNGDVANKIGTYTLAVLAQAHGLPFYVAAPLSTVDLSLPDGEAIPIEERDPAEVTGWAGIRTAPVGARARNPVFDMTPHRYITALITNRGVVRPPYDSGLTALAGPDLSGRV